MLLEVHFVCQPATDIDPCQLQLSRLLLWGLLSSSLTWPIVIIRHHQTLSDIIRCFYRVTHRNDGSNFKKKKRKKKRENIGIMRPPVHITPYKSTYQETTLGATYLWVAKEYNILSPWMNISSTDRLFKGQLYIQ
jgi:hypothetical protein